MKWFRWISVLLVFAVEIRVKAYQQEPKRCLVSEVNQPCSILSSRIERLNLKNYSFQVSAGTLMYRDNEGRWNLVKGTVRVKTSVPLSIHSKVGEAQLKPGVQWVQWRQDKLWVYTIQGESNIKLNSTKLTENVVPAGFFNWYGLIDSMGVNPQGVPRRITGLVAKMFLPGVAKSPDFKEIKRSEARVIGVASEFYQEIAQSMEDGAVAREQKVLNEKATRKRFDQNLRQMFRNKYLGPVDTGEGDENSNN